KEGMSLEYSSFLKIIDKFGIKTEENFLKIIAILEQKIKSIETIFPNLSVQKTTHYDRVKTRERSRKQKQLIHTKNRLLSGIDEPMRDTKSKYWDCSQLIIGETFEENDFENVISDFSDLDRTNFNLQFGIERFKTSEVFYQPSLVGFDNMGGIGDTFSRLLKTKTIFD
ncbi:hypothetical protein MHBO_004634, partial [Bonamia ostreae]